MLPKMDEEEEDAVALAAAAAVVRYNQQLIQRKRRWVYRPLYGRGSPKRLGLQPYLK